MDSAEIVLVIFCAFVFPFDTVKPSDFEGHQEGFRKVDYRTHWHIDCDMPRQEGGTGKEVLSAEFWVLSWQIRNLKCGMRSELARRDVGRDSKLGLPRIPNFKFRISHFRSRASRVTV
jgi:hypothetical protein